MTRWFITSRVKSSQETGRNRFWLGSLPGNCCAYLSAFATTLVFFCGSVNPGLAQKAPDNDPISITGRSPVTILPRPEGGAFSARGQLRAAPARFGLRGNLSRGGNGVESNDAVFGGSIDDGAEGSAQNNQTESTLAGEADESLSTLRGGVRRGPLALADERQGAARPAQAEPGVLDDEALSETPTARGNSRAEIVESSTGRRLVEDPFSPTGRRLGSFELFTRFEQSLGYTTNADSGAGSSGGGVSSTTGSFQLRSDWSRHSLNFDGTANWLETFGDDGESSPSAALNGELRLDLIDGFSATAGANYNYTRESTSSNNLTASVTNRPGVHAFGGNIGIEREDRKIGLALRGSILRTLYEDADLSTGGVLSQADRNNNRFGVVGRVSYEVTPAFKPFIEGELAWREHDEAIDRNGLDRDSRLHGIRGGIVFDRGDKWSGELAIGYEEEVFDDARIDALETVTLDGNVNWSPERDTNIRLTLATDLAGSVNPGQSGSITHDVDLEIERIINDRTQLTLSGGIARTDFAGTARDDMLYEAGVGIRYWVNRFTAVTADLGYETLDSTSTAQSYDATTATVGIIWQN